MVWCELHFHLCIIMCVIVVKRNSLHKTYRWVGKTLDIVASSIISMYDVDKKQNCVLNIP